MSNPPLPPESDPDATISPSELNRALPDPVPLRIEGYRLLEEISRGGQAIVHAATFLRTGRKVAVKVMREGPLATESGRARFTREAQILASLNHPNIVTILDRGRTADGSEYFAMDYIDGTPLDEGTWKSPGYLASVQDNPAKPLQLFLKICDAVNAAHLRGIVHRDLKPSNIRLDERGEPHVLDFGLARGGFLGDSQTATSEPITITGQFLGSLPWASPEQAEGVGQKIDMRSDVYSLGVILYQLVTGGRFPYQVVGSMRDILNNIMTAEPPAPSVIMAQREAQDLKRRARRTGLPGTLLNPVLDAIILRALAKRRDDRYQSAGELSRDIENYLAGRPTIAGGAPRRKIRIPPLLLGIVGATAAGLLVGITVGLVNRSMKSAKSPAKPVASAPATPAPAAAAPAPIDPAVKLHPLIAASPLAADYQELSHIMGQFVAISSYIQTMGPQRFAAWRAAADAGDPVGQMFVSRCYQWGVGVQANGQEANRLLLVAANRGLPLAMCLIGINYRASQPPNQNYAQALSWYRRAADAGDGRAMTDLGLMYRDALGVERDYSEALRWFQKSADLSTPCAWSMLADAYNRGTGVDLDIDKAVALNRRAAEAGVPNAMISLGYFYENGRGVTRDYAQAMALFRQADDAGATGAAHAIGDLYANGLGVTQSYVDAAVWYRKGADANVVAAQRKLGDLYEQGKGVAKDHATAVELYTRAAGNGDAEANLWLKVNATNPAR